MVVKDFSEYSGIFIAGHRGMVGSSIKRALLLYGVDESSIITKTHDDLDLKNQEAVANFFLENNIELVILAAAKVGGISANINYPAEFIYDNLMIQSNVIHAAYLNNIKELIFLGSSCIYPRFNDKKLSEDCLLTDSLEKSNEPYAIAKIAGIKMCESYNRQYGTDYRSIMPTNLYGLGDNYHPENSHVIPGLIRRFHEAKKNNFDSVEIWGSGLAKREFLNVDDLAMACMHIIKIKKEDFNELTKGSNLINVGFGSDITIKELAQLISKTIGFEGNLEFNNDKNKDGVPQKLLDSSRLNSSGWYPSIQLKEGLQNTYNDYLHYNP